MTRKTQTPDGYAWWGSTKARRDQARKAFHALAKEIGADIRPGIVEGEREVSVTIFKGPYEVHLDVDGDSHVGAFLGHWTTASWSEMKYPKDFGVWIGGSINECHHRKATTVEDTFEGLKRSVRQGFERLAREDDAEAA